MSHAGVCAVAVCVSETEALIVAIRNNANKVTLDLSCEIFKFFFFLLQLYTFLWRFFLCSASAIKFFLWLFEVISALHKTFFILPNWEANRRLRPSGTKPLKSAVKT